MQENKMDNRDENNKKICFIMCSNDEEYLEETTYYINRLNVPAGYKVEVVPIIGAKSMTSGYNEAMHKSDAKYKVYMHQDVFIVNDNFIYDMLKVFEDKNIGMFGMIGTPKLHESGIMWFGDRCGSLFSSNVDTSGIAITEIPITSDYMEVEAIDGLLMATAYDIEWREDLFEDWDFYDVSESLEFRKAGYKVVVVKQEQPWCLHDDGYMNLRNYHKNLEILKKEYFTV